MKKYILDYIYIITGCAIMGIGTSLFLLPNQLSSGGFSGIATIIYYIFKYPIGTVTLVLNTPLYIIAFLKLDKSSFLKSIFGMFGLSFFLNLFQRFTPLTNDRFLACIYGGIFIGIGLAIVLKGHSSTGGTDLITQIVKIYKPHFKSSSLIVIIDVAIVVLNVMFFKTIEIGLYSAITIYIAGKMIDLIFEGINFTKMIYIISSKHAEISKEIEEKMGRGCTGIYSKGMYTNRKKMMILCVVSRTEVARIKEIALGIDEKAFVVIANARETWGKGFKEE